MVGRTLRIVCQAKEPDSKNQASQISTKGKPTGTEVGLEMPSANCKGYSWGAKRCWASSGDDQKMFNNGLRFAEL